MAIVSKKTFLVPIAAAAALALSLVGGRALAAEIKLPPETARLRESPLPGYSVANSMCVTCHSPDYVKMQPTFSRAVWKTEVTKMQKTFGAPIPDADVDPIVDYLVKTYGNERASASAQPAGASPAKRD